jgi:hypothetical protein
MPNRTKVFLVIAVLIIIAGLFMIEYFGVFMFFAIVSLTIAIVVT